MHKKFIIRLICLVAGLLLLTLAVLRWWSYMHNLRTVRRMVSNPPTMISIITRERAHALGLTTLKVRMLPLPHFTQVIGDVVADESRTTHLSLRFTGTIVEMRSDSNAKEVHQGEILFVVRSNELNAIEQEYLLALRSTVSNEGNVRRHIDGLKHRLERLGLTQTDLAAMERKGEPLRDLSIRSPVSGYILSQTTTSGMNVVPGYELVSITDLAHVIVVTHLDSQEGSLLRVGQKAEFHALALGRDYLEGRLKMISPATDRLEHPLLARFEFLNPEKRLLPGMFGEVLIIHDVSPALVVAREAVVFRRDVAYVYVARGDGAFEPRVVTLGRSTPSEIEVKAGLNEGEVVIRNAAQLDQHS